MKHEYKKFKKNFHIKTIIKLFVLNLHIQFMIHRTLNSYYVII